MKSVPWVSSVHHFNTSSGNTWNFFFLQNLVLNEQGHVTAIRLQGGPLQTPWEASAALRFLLQEDRDKDISFPYPRGPRTHLCTRT